MTRPVSDSPSAVGSAHGWAHIGIIDSLIENGIEPDVACCTSVGARSSGCEI
jgi:predicted acylesterase/phospholipase RssA